MINNLVIGFLKKYLPHVIVELREQAAKDFLDYYYRVRDRQDYVTVYKNRRGEKFRVRVEFIQYG